MFSASAAAGRAPALRWPDRLWSVLQTPAAVACLALLCTLAAHIPAYGLRGGDDPFFIEVAHGWLTGAPPYLDAFDVKPPGYFFLLAAMETVFGPTETAVNALTVLCEAATAFCLWRLCRQLNMPAVGLVAPLGYPLLSQMLSNNPGYPPLALATTAAFALATCGYGWRTRVVLAGLTIGFAATIKQSAGLEALALLWLLIREPQAERRRWLGALTFAAAAAAPPLAFALAFALQGAFAPFFADVVLTALRRPGVEPEAPLLILGHFVSVQRKILPLLAFAAIGVARPGALMPGAPAGRVEGVLLWLAASWLELLLQHARWVLYLGPTFAPVLLLSAAAIDSLLRSDALKRLAFLVLLLVTAANAYPFRLWQLLGPMDGPTYEAATQAIAARHPEPQDRLLGLGVLEATELNADTGLKPPTRYYYWLHLACDFPGAGPARLREALAVAPRFVVVATRPYDPYCEDPSVWPLIHATLAHGYRQIGAAPVEAPQLLIYEREGANPPAR